MRVPPGKLESLITVLGGFAITVAMQYLEARPPGGLMWKAYDDWQEHKEGREIA